MNAQWICATARFSSFRGSGMIASPLALRGRSEPGGPALRRAFLEVDPVGGVELRRAGIAWPVAVERVEVEARRARLQQRRRRDVDALHQRALVERQVVVDELAEVRVAGRDLPRREIVVRHRLRDLQAVRPAELLARPLRPEPREPKRRSRGQRRRGPRGRGKRYDIPAAASLAEQALADDVVGLRTMPFHTHPPSYSVWRGGRITRRFSCLVRLTKHSPHVKSRLG